MRARLAERAASLYMNAGNPDVSAVDVSNVVELGARAHYGNVAAEQDHALLNAVVAADERLVTLQYILQHEQDAVACSSSNAHPHAPEAEADGRATARAARVGEH